MADYSYLIDRLRNAAGGDLGRKMCADAADVIAALQSKCDAQDKYIDALTKQSAANRRMAERTYDSAMGRIKAYDAIIAGLHRDRDVLQRKLDAAMADIKELVTKHGTCICDLCRFYDGMECSIQKGCKWEWRGVQEVANENQT